MDDFATGTELGFSPETQERMRQMKLERLRQPQMPTLQDALVQPAGGGGGLMDFFRSLFNRQNELDDIQKGLRGPAQPTNQYQEGNFVRG